jgi:AraC-like DNA-binding protein
MNRLPHVALRPFIKTLWVSEHARPQGLRLKERALPDGHMHVVIRLTGAPIRILDTAHPTGHSYGYSVIGGARSSYYVRELPEPARAIGATLLPGAAHALFGVSALELANRHTSLVDLWGAQVDALRNRLLQVAQPRQQLELFELFLLARVPQVKGLHPAIAQVFANTPALHDVRSMVSSSGLSHRRFVELFGHAVGLTPKRFARVLRFQGALKSVGRNPRPRWSEVALNAGYSDQAHFNREFREFGGLTPEEYRRAAPESPGHVRIIDLR